MEEIKSIRVRDTEKYGFDYKISLFRDNNNNNRKIIVFNEEGDTQLISAPLKITEMTFGSKFKNYPDGVRVGSSNSNKFDGVIGNYLDQMVNLGYLSNTYRVLQDPWTNITPKKRAFGFDYYYLNNGCRIQIEWLDGSGFTRGGDKWSDDEGNELDITSGQDKSGIYKYAKIWIPYDSDEKPKVMALYSGVFYDFNELRSDNETYSRWQKQYQNGNPKDNFILKQIIDQWKINVPNYNLELCNPDNEGCSIIPYINPIESPPAVEPPVDNTPPTEEQTQPVVEPGVTFDVTKEGFFVNSEFGELRIVNPGLDEFDFGDDFDDLDLLDDQYSEQEFDGLDEQEYNLQEEIADSQEDATNVPTSTEYVGQPGDPVTIQKVTDFDSLLRLAGNLARELGKNSRVNYDNLNSGYKKGVHGLCPQGTQAVLAALTGVKTLGKIGGNADWFSFKTPGTGGGNSSFSKSGYFNEKVKITQINGSWKGTYLQDSSKWQIGDVVAAGYLNGKPYGHIQVWTGVKWMSDFKQNAIQQRNVDPNTVALWRLNDKGLQAVNSQSGRLA